MKTMIALTLVYLIAWPALADPVHVEHTVGAMRGFFVIRSQGGNIIGHGELSEYAVGDRITVRTTMHFRDGSLDDETSVATQRDVFHFVSDHHIQRGPFFKNALDMTIEASGDVTLRTTGKDGKEKVETNHFDLPPDLSNGSTMSYLLNMPRHTEQNTLSMLLPAGKGRVAKLIVTPNGTRSFTAVTGDRRSANIYKVHIDLGGVAGVIAPILGKQPQDMSVWILEGEVPLVVRQDVQIAEDAPIISIQLAGTSFSNSAPKK
jgi:hypothetical protein